ncbi:hypothetical protein UFOVP787_29 [uncultured Caudovirales phage]|uniref:DUF6321 domain-containing protein n=1 Tax=uncultured Caudovirales phage TaxID=2100421 RepID=A0A6J5NSG5_9CAUD|nr:hypothetical protein UFOVP787_29 [uncultured Caudovirales phage]
MVKTFSKFRPRLESAGSAIALTNEQKLSLYKKSQKSGISTDILEEVYRRGYSIWNESFGQTAEQFAFDRVNSFISGGFAAELDEDLKQACWKGYTAVGMKMKNGKKVPNCVPVKEGKTPHETSKHFKTSETAELQSVDSNDPDSRFDGTNSVRKIYTKATPGQTIKKTIKETLEELDEKWSDSKYKNPSGGLTKAGVMAYRRENPGSKLKTAVTTPPSKLKLGSKAANRRKSFCARMGGMKKRLTSAKTARDPDSRINKSLRKWNCEETVYEMSVPAGTTGKRKEWNPPMVGIRMASGKIEKHPPGKSGSSGGGNGD